MENAFMTGGGGSTNSMRPSLGAGLAEGAANLKTLHAQWQEDYTNGVTQLQFRDWMKQRGMSNAAMDR
jgi:hypothetical protein